MRLLIAKILEEISTSNARLAGAVGRLLHS